MSSKLLNAFLVVCTAICLVTLIILFILASTTLGQDNIFPHGILRNDSYEYPSKLIPAKWTHFTVWIIVLAFQHAWVLYAHSLLCRKSWYKSYLYIDPPFLPHSFYGIYIIALTMVVLWLFAQDNNFMTAALISIAGSTFSLSICLYISVHQLWACEDWLSKSGMWAIIVLVQNGLGMFVTWCWMLTLLNLDTVLVKHEEMSVQDSGTICLIILLIVTMIYVCADKYLSKKWFRYLLSPYIIVTLTVVGIIHDNWEDGARTSYFMAGSLCTLIAGSLAKLGAIVYWTRTNELSIEATFY